MSDDDDSDQLRRLEAFADAQLAYLDHDALLAELLDRVRAVLNVDTVAVLIVDDPVDPRSLIAHAALGLEEEVRLGVRIPIGEGFAGRVAAQRMAVILEHVGPDVVLNPILWRRGIKSLLGIPLLVAGDLLGVMHVGTLKPRRFAEHEVDVLFAAADRVAAAITASQAIADRSAARVLQRSLVPHRLPELDGIEFAARFVTAAQFGVGGDWYDVFVLPDGRVGMVIGDVAGSGLRAAVVMGRMRSVLRGYAVELGPPSDVLARLDRAFTHLEPNEMATVSYGIVDLRSSTLTLASAGHLPAVLARPGEPTRLVSLRPAPPICSGVAGVADDVVIDLPIGTTFGLYTDGLVERRTRPLADGLHALQRSFVAGSADSVCSTVIDDLVGDGDTTDDTAVLVASVTS